MLFYPQLVYYLRDQEVLDDATDRVDEIPLYEYEDYQLGTGYEPIPVTQF